MQKQKFTTEPDPGHKIRMQAWEHIIPLIERYLSNTSDLRVSPILNQKEIKTVAQSNDFNGPMEISDAVDFIVSAMNDFMVHTPHPRYMGLFNPRTTFPSILGDLLTAVYNPQMAAWSHAPFPAEIETHLIQSLGEKLGYKRDNTDGVFTSGGAEANLTALLTALNYAFPEWKEYGARGLSSDPVFYVSEESHHSFIKAASMVGLGRKNVRSIRSDHTQSMIVEELKETVERDIREGFKPFMVVATLGTTGSGGIDPIEEICEISKTHDLWLHADAAWAGAVSISDKYKHLLGDTSLADSITVDAHKWLSVPMGAGMYITRHTGILTESFSTNNQYMPRDAQGIEVVDPYGHSVQWSRRFTGLKLYLSLLVLGWEGYASQIEKDFDRGNYLRERLVGEGWKIYNLSPLPVICFGMEEKENDPGWIAHFCKKVVEDGRIWISVYPVGKVDCLRACITNYQTGFGEIDEIVYTLNLLRG